MENYGLVVLTILVRFLLKRKKANAKVFWMFEILLLCLIFGLVNVYFGKQQRLR